MQNLKEGVKSFLLMYVNPRFDQQIKKFWLDQAQVNQCSVAVVKIMHTRKNIIFTTAPHVVFVVWIC